MAAVLGAADVDVSKDLRAKVELVETFDLTREAKMHPSVLATPRVKVTDDHGAIP